MLQHKLTCEEKRHKLKYEENKNKVKHEKRRSSNKKKHEEKNRHKSKLIYLGVLLPLHSFHISRARIFLRSVHSAYDSMEVIYSSFSSESVSLVSSYLSNSCSIGSTTISCHIMLSNIQHINIIRH